MEFKHGLDARPPTLELLLFGLQWLAISVPTIVIVGKVVAAIHFPDYGDQVLYLQKVSFVTAVTLLGELFWGHRLPLVPGPASVLLIGVTASQGFALDTVYSSILLGGLALAVLSVTGLFEHVQRLFSARVVAVVLLLIAFTLTPTIGRLIVPASPPSPAPVLGLGFALALVAVTFVAHRRLGGVWRSTLIVWAMAAGSLAFLIVFPGSRSGAGWVQAPLTASPLHHLTAGLELHPGVLVSFLFCFLALAVNDVGSIQSMEELLRPGSMPARITRGMAVTGLGNVLAGFLGVLGPVNYSLSPGVIASTGCASRFTLVPAGIVLLLLSFSPAAVAWIGAVPPVVVGSVLLYVLSAQVAAGLLVAFRAEERFTLETGLAIGAPVLLGAMVASLPPPVVEAFPTVLKPILGNGFVVGVVASLFLEHGVFRSRTGPARRNRLRQA